MMAMLRGRRDNEGRDKEMRQSRKYRGFGQVLGTLTEGLKGAYYVTFSPDGKTIVSGSFDKTVKV